MKKSKKDTAKDGGIQLGLFSVEDSHANHTAQQESDSERKMLDTSGRRCLGSYANAHPTRLWARMFLESLVGTGDWSSKRCKLTWKLKGSKYKRLWFQLVPSALPTEGIGFGLLPTPAAQEGFDRMGGNPIITANGSVRNQNLDGSQSRMGLKGAVNHLQGLNLLPTTTETWEEEVRIKGSQNSHTIRFALLPTPDCQNHRDGTKLRKDNNMEDGGSHGVSLHHLGAHGMLPTPQSRDEKNGSKMDDGRMKRKVEEGYSLNLNDLAASRLLPTPRAAEYKGTGPKGSKSNDHRANRDYLDGVIVEEFGTTGQTSQLSGRFVLEMMGFPPDWVESAYLALENESPNQG